jgi:hypothetical protein
MPAASTAPADRGASDCCFIRIRDMESKNAATVAARAASGQRFLSTGWYPS